MFCEVCMNFLIDTKDFPTMMFLLGVSEYENWLEMKGAHFLKVF